MFRVVQSSPKAILGHFHHPPEETPVSCIGPSLASTPAPVLVRVLSCLSRVRPFATPWTVARQAPLSVGFSRQEHCSGLPRPPPGDPPDPGMEPVSPASPAVAAGFFTTVPPGKPTYALANCARLCPALVNGFFSFRDKCFILWQQTCKTLVHLLF